VQERTITTTDQEKKKEERREEKLSSIDGSFFAGYVHHAGAVFENLG